MKIESDKRRRFIRAGMSLPLLSYLPVIPSRALAEYSTPFFVPEKIYHELFAIYGGDANSIMTTNKIQVNTPEIAENGAVVPVSVKGEQGLVSSVAIFVTKNPRTFVTYFTLHPGTDLSVGTRIKVRQTDDVYVIAQTKHGLVGAKRTVKVTIGCGGA